MSQAVICAYKRTPFTPANKGSLAKVRPDELAVAVMKALLDESKLDPALLEDVLIGCAFPEGEQGFNIGRMAVMLAGLPDSVGGATVNRWCGSSMNAIHMAAGSIAAGAGDAFLCVGVESMTRIPMGGFNPLPHTGLYMKRPEAYMSMGLTAEAVAKHYNIDRDAQQAFALESHQKAAAAIAKGLDEIVEVNGASVDECVRAETSVEKMSELNPAFDKNGTVTAATSSPITDGAAGVLVTSEAFAKEHGLVPLAKIKSMAVAGCKPEIMGIGPVPATQKALKRAGLSMGDMGVIELNEAFAAQSLAVIKDLNIQEASLNVDGGAIAIGHPLGASGARVTGKAAALLQREGKQHALATMCIGGGQGIATVLEAC